MILGKRWRIALLLVVAMALSIFISACGGSTDTGSTPTAGATTLGTPGAYNCVPGTISIDGSSALQPLTKAASDAYAAKCSGATFTVAAGGSKKGLADVEAGSVAIGDSDVFANASTQGDLTDHQVSVVVFTLVINSKVTGVTNLTTTQVQGIYAGTTKNWKDVGGPNLPIVVVSRPSTSGTRATFEKYILAAPEGISGPTALQTDSTTTVLTNVKQTDGAIGYAALGQAKASGLTVLSLDGNAPTATLVESNTYKFWNIEHMYTKGSGTGLAQALIDYMTNSDTKTIAEGQSFITITDMSAAAIMAHQP